MSPPGQAIRPPAAVLSSVDRVIILTVMTVRSGNRAAGFVRGHRVIGLPGSGNPGSLASFAGSIGTLASFGEPGHWPVREITGSLRFVRGSNCGRSVRTTGIRRDVCRDKYPLFIIGRASDRLPKSGAWSSGVGFVAIQGGMILRCWKRTLEIRRPFKSTIASLYSRARPLTDRLQATMTAIAWPSGDQYGRTSAPRSRPLPWQS